MIEQADRQSERSLTAVRAFLLAVLVALPATVRAEAILLMAEEDGCFWCERWNTEIAVIYPKTAEGKAAPLRRYDIHDTPPDGISLTSSVRFTPTFLLVQDGVQVDRLEGYPGEDFFWGLLAMMLERAGIAQNEAG
ncbi:MAG: hypothetical protein GKR99_19230 [Rhodobacteraceae bacterium]|nr:hypothetical protein [Paracoccaceae bacterium]